MVPFNALPTKIHRTLAGRLLARVIRLRHRARARAQAFYLNAMSRSSLKSPSSERRSTDMGVLSPTPLARLRDGGALFGRPVITGPGESCASHIPNANGRRLGLARGSVAPPPKKRLVRVCGPAAPLSVLSGQRRTPPSIVKRAAPKRRVDGPHPECPSSCRPRNACNELPWRGGRRGPGERDLEQGRRGVAAAAGWLVPPAELRQGSGRGGPSRV